MRTLCICCLSLFLAMGRAAPAAEETFLSYRFSAFSGSPVHTMGQKLKTAPASAEKSGLKLPTLKSGEPVYLTAALGNGPDAARALVLDESGGTGTGYDLLYADANNNRDLTDDRPVHRLQRQGRPLFGPLALLVRINGHTQLYHAAVEASTRGPAAEYTLKNLGYYTGRARFGDRSYTVGLVDTNANGIYGDPFRELSPEGGRMGDQFLVDVNDDGSFEGGMIPKETLFCGKCIAVDGRFFELAMEPDGSRVRVAPAQVKLAALKADYPSFSMLLAGDHGVFPVEGRNGEIRVPEGNYRILLWSIEHRAMEGTWRAMGGSWNGGAPEVRVNEGGGATFKLSVPLLAKVGSQPTTPGSLDFSLGLTTSSGESIADLGVDGRRPPEPILRITDEDGKEVAVLKFHYG
jgi:hypothetical protein